VAYFGQYFVAPVNFLNESLRSNPHPTHISFGLCTTSSATRVSSTSQGQSTRFRDISPRFLTGRVTVETYDGLFATRVFIYSKFVGKRSLLIAVWSMPFYSFNEWHSRWCFTFLLNDMIGKV